VIRFEENIENEVDWYSEIRHLSGNDLHIPRGKTLIIGASPKRIRVLLIEGTLIVKEGVASDIVISVSHIIIKNGGKLIIDKT
jgi:hypothetical protein